jgi:hypothetical protein
MLRQNFLGIAIRKWADTYDFRDMILAEDCVVDCT